MSAISPRARHIEAAGLFFLQGMGMGMWFVPLSPILDAYGMQEIKPQAFATSAVAAFVSPLIFGAMADRHLGPVAVFRWLALGAAGCLSLVAAALEQGASRWVVLGLIQLLAFFLSPTWSIVTTVTLASLTDPKRQFGPVRALGTAGWIAGCWLVSALHADASILAGHSAIIVWLLIAMFTFFLPNVAPAKSSERLTLRQRFGLDALSLLKNPEHRAVFMTAALASVPLAAFYPFTPAHLREFGLERTSAWMTLGQVTEILAMLGLSSLLLKWRLKWIFAAGLACALLRYVFCAFDAKGWLLAGISLHGFAFTLFFVTAPVYLDGAVDPKWRARAQALISLMTIGLGNLFGYLGCGWWFQLCSRLGEQRWLIFWGGLAAVVGLVLGYFLIMFRSPKAAKP